MNQPKLEVDSKAIWDHISGSLLLEVICRNRSEEALFTLDRHWTQNDQGKPVWDPRAPYRFIHPGSLHVLFGCAPIFDNMSVSNMYIPHATRILPGSEILLRGSIPIPVKEYSPFFPDRADTEYERLQLSSVAVIVQYVLPDSRCKIDPSFIDPAAWWVRAPFDATLSARGETQVAPFEAIRRKDAIARA